PMSPPASALHRHRCHRPRPHHRGAAPGQSVARSKRRFEIAVTLSSPPPPNLVIHTNTWVTGWLSANGTTVSPACSVVEARTVVSPRALTGLGADLICTWLPTLGEVMVNEVNWTGPANPTMIPTPGLSAGN